MVIVEALRSIVDVRVAAQLREVGRDLLQREGLQASS